MRRRAFRSRMQFTRFSSRTIVMFDWNAYAAHLFSSRTNVLFDWNALSCLSQRNRKALPGKEAVNVGHLIHHARGAPQLTVSVRDPAVGDRLSWWFNMCPLCGDQLNEVCMLTIKILYSTPTVLATTGLFLCKCLISNIAQLQNPLILRAKLSSRWSSATCS